MNQKLKEIASAGLKWLLAAKYRCMRSSRDNIMTDAFGVVALVALTPLIAVQIMGMQYKTK